MIDAATGILLGAYEDPDASPEPRSCMISKLTRGRLLHVAASQNGIGEIGWLSRKVKDVLAMTTEYVGFGYWRPTSGRLLGSYEHSG
jgi:hypothetical protein